MKKEPSSRTTGFLKVLIVLGLVFVATAGFLAQETLNFVLKAESTKGQVIEVKSHSEDWPDEQGNMRKLTVYVPRVEYKPPDGKTYEIQGVRTPDIRSFQQGQTVQVLYLKDEPHQARINSISQLWGDEIYAALAGLGMILLGTIVLIFQRKNKT